MRVAAGAVAKKLLRERAGVAIVGYVKQVGDLEATIADPTAVTLEQVEATPVRCPDPAMARADDRADRAHARRERLDRRRRRARRDRRAGGLGRAGVRQAQGRPGKALFSLPAVLGVEYGAGFAVAAMRGSRRTTPSSSRGGRIATETNRHGGMLGGISSGMPIVLRCAIKPTSSLPREQRTVTRSGEPTTIATKGRHDPCLLPRFVPMGEAMVAITLADHALRQQASR